MPQNQLPEHVEAAASEATEAVSAPEPEDQDWRQVSWLPCELSLELPVAGLTVRDLLRLRPGRIVETRCSRSREIPLRANGQVIGSAELEAVGAHIGVRITELS